MAKKTPVKKIKTVSTLTVPDMTVFVNCMTPCSKCDKLKQYVTSSVREWAKKQGYTITINSNSNKTVDYWKTYGKPKKVLQSTPQMYVVKTQEKFAGVAVHESATVGSYKIPAINKWNSTMVKDIITALVTLC